ncbi:hypothetical protein [Conexibacter woesei]|uniref:hypothetical protein n=1 Tax=Conexibacter woesei TaxID=191495 RepID=UPI000407E4A8|nr:hypothetical protein [Conexibacter woesei]
MPLDPINPVGPRRAAVPESISGVRRVESSTDKQREQPDGRRKRRPPVVPDLPPPPDDGLPHIDVRV